MSSPSNLSPMQPREFAAYGFERVRAIAFAAVRDLWERRRASGMTQKELSEIIGRDPAWVSKNLRGPGNWTMKTFGELVYGLSGEVEIRVFGLEDPLETPSNYDAYSAAEPDFLKPPPSPNTSARTDIKLSWLS